MKRHRIMLVFALASCQVKAIKTVDRTFDLADFGGTGTQRIDTGFPTRFSDFEITSNDILPCGHGSLTYSDRSGETISFNLDYYEAESIAAMPAAVAQACTRSRSPSTRCNPDRYTFSQAAIYYQSGQLLELGVASKNEAFRKHLFLRDFGDSVRGYVVKSTLPDNTALDPHLAEIRF
jgi:hypothetical protein